jgi:hypothetical protein
VVELPKLVVMSLRRMLFDFKTFDSAPFAELLTSAQKTDRWFSQGPPDSEPHSKSCACSGKIGVGRWLERRCTVRAAASADGEPLAVAFDTKKPERPLPSLARRSIRRTSA